MKTIETTAVIGKDHVLSIQLPDSIEMGEAKVVIIIDENRDEKQPPLGMRRFLSNCQNNYLGLRDKIQWDRDELYR